MALVRHRAAASALRTIVSGHIDGRRAAGHCGPICGAHKLRADVLTGDVFLHAASDPCRTELALTVHADLKPVGAAADGEKAVTGLIIFQGAE